MVGASARPIHQDRPTAAMYRPRSAVWAVGAGERFRYRTAPGIRVTTTTLRPDEAHRLADDLTAAIGGRNTTYAG